MSPDRRVLTMGVYGFTEPDFFARLVAAHVDVFVDIRARRGMRGRDYAFVNSARLQARLSELDIAYLHVKDLAPTGAIRTQQKQDDAAQKQAKRTRTQLGDDFIAHYTAEVLIPFDWPTLLASLAPEWRTLCLFCVERDPAACHRSLAAPALAARLGAALQHLV